MGNRVSQLQFDEGPHVYTLDGAVVANVTDVLGGVGIGEITGVSESVLAAARERGKAVHKACADYDHGALDLRTLPEAYIPYVVAYSKFVVDTGFEPTLVECRVLSEQYGYCGTLDRMGELDGIETVLDIKTGVLGPAAGPQVAAYAAAAVESYGMTPKRRMALVLNPSGYKLEPLTDAQDWKVFLAALTVHHFKARTQ